MLVLCKIKAIPRSSGHLASVIYLSSASRGSSVQYEDFLLLLFSTDEPHAPGTIPYCIIHGGIECIKMTVTSFLSAKEFNT